MKGIPPILFGMVFILHQIAMKYRNVLNAILVKDEIETNMPYRPLYQLYILIYLYNLEIYPAENIWREWRLLSKFAAEKKVHSQ